MKIYASKTKKGTIIHLPETEHEFMSMFDGVHGPNLDLALLLNRGAYTTYRVERYEAIGGYTMYRVHSMMSGGISRYNAYDLMNDTSFGEALKKRALIVTVDEKDCACERDNV